MEIDRAVIEINGGCNYTCQMCPQGSESGRHKSFLKKMPLTMFEDAVAQCAEKGLNVVNLDGSGEATLNANLPKYIEIVKKYNAKAYIFSNGRRMRDQYMKDCVDAGLDLFRFSIIGYDVQTYRKWMNSPDGFNIVTLNLKEMQDYINSTKSECIVSTYNLILDNKKMLYEIDRYKELANWAGVKTEIWQMHNWSGVYSPERIREGGVKTCGRPFSPDIVIRAGGNDGERGAVHPCCQVLGRDDEAVLGHMSQNTLEEIWNGTEYNKLRSQHMSGDYPDYCKSCDFLIDDPEVLVYSNYDRDLYKMAGTNFDLNDYRI